MNKKDLEAQFETGLIIADVDPIDRPKIRAQLGELEFKDEKTYEHSLRVGLIAQRIAEYLAIDSKAALFAGALHDIGKADIPEEVLYRSNNSGFTEEDMSIMERHVGYGRVRLEEGGMPFTARVIEGSHEHQRKPYPDNRISPKTPFSQETIKKADEASVILSIADKYDAAMTRYNNRNGNRELTSDRIRESIIEEMPSHTSLINNLYENKVLE